MRFNKYNIVILIFTFFILAPIFFMGCATPPPSTKPAEALSSKLIKIEKRKGVTLKFILIKPENPVASVILLDGYGSYQMGSIFGRPTIGKGQNGFLVRTRNDFARHSLMVAVVDIPSDQKPTQNPMLGIDPTFRMSNEHAQDMKAISSYLKREANIPVWLIGMCMGTFSAANASIRINEGIDGLVFLSGVTRPKKSSQLFEINPNGIINLSLNMVKVPTLIIAHKDDKCRGTPPSDALKIKRNLANSPLVEVEYFIGGKMPISKPCQALSAHGFYGIEERVIVTIADFIKSSSK
jgi:hypothetical protein